jgi:hypothetical protein
MAIVITWFRSNRLINSEFNMSGVLSSVKVVLFASVVGFVLVGGAEAQTITSADRHEQNLHKRWIEATLAKIGKDPSVNPPADILLTYAPTGLMTVTERKQERSQRDWLIRTLKKIRAVQVGSTRGKLLKVFTAEGGLASRTQETFADRTCPYIKVDVEFRAGSNIRHAPKSAKVTDQYPTDVITKITAPYLAYTIVE